MEYHFLKNLSKKWAFQIVAAVEDFQDVFFQAVEILSKITFREVLNILFAFLLLGFQATRSVGIQELRYQEATVGGISPS